MAMFDFFVIWEISDKKGKTLFSDFWGEIIGLFKVDFY